jgi:hypothetical protein
MFPIICLVRGTVPKYCQHRISTLNVMILFFSLNIFVKFDGIILHNRFVYKSENYLHQVKFNDSFDEIFITHEIKLIIKLKT